MEIMSIDTELIERVEQMHRDSAWINAHADDLYRTMREMLKNRKLVGEVVKNLLLIYPVLLERHDLRRWAKLTYRAHHKIQRNEQRRKPRMQYSVQQAYLITPVATSRSKPRKPRSERLNQRELFEVFLSLMMSQIYAQPSDLAQSTAECALAFARRINDQYYYNKLYQTLAYIHLANARFDKALEHGRLAYLYWEGHEDRHEDGLTAFAIAMAYRGKGEWDATVDWLDKASEIFSKSDHPRTYGIIALERSATDIYLGHFESACQWARLALDEFQAQGMEFHTGLGFHMLGLSLAYRGDLDDAIDNLWRSINYWESVGNLLEQIHAEFSLVFAEARQGRRERAIMRIERNRDLCKRLPESYRKTFHLQQVDRLEKAIKHDEDLLRVFTRQH